MRLLGLVVVTLWAVYATAEPQLHAEVHTNGRDDDMLPPPQRFGERRRAYVTAKSTQATMAIPSGGNPARNVNAIISRRYDSPERPASQQLVRQYKVPIVHKSTDEMAEAHKSGQLHQQQQQPRHRSRYSNIQEAIETDGGGRHPPQPQTSSTSPRNASRSTTRRGNVKTTNSNASLVQKSRKTTTTTTTTSTTTTTTPRPQLQFGNFQFTNPFELITQNIWNFLNLPNNNQNNNKNNNNNHLEQTPPSSPPAPHKKPPKKYTPPLAGQTSSAAEKPQLKQKPTKTPPPTTTTTTSAKPPSTDGPFRIALPTLNFFQAAPAPGTDATKEGKDKRYIATDGLRERFTCPRESEVRFQLFPKICKNDGDCSVWNREELCCEIFGAMSCVTGMPKPLEESSHMPILGLIPRKCPSRPLAELWWEVQECETDNDCWPRVCCPDGRRRYCRTSQPELETVPVPVRRSFNYLTEYLECTAPPPPIFDLHPKSCTSTIECFPNVCCQEAGRRHCRPPKKSVLTLMANVFNVDFVKRLTQNIVIK